MRSLKAIAIFALVLLLSAMGLAQRKGGGPPPGRGGGAPPLAPQASPPAQNQPDSRRFVLHGPGPHMGDWLRRHRGMSTEEQERALQQDPDFRRLDPERQRRLRQRLQRFSTLPPDQQQRILSRMETFEHLTPAQQARARDMFRDFRRLPPDRKRALGQAFRDLRAMSPEDRQKTLASETYRNRFNDQERQLLQGMSELNLIPDRGEREQAAPPPEL